MNQPISKAKCFSSFCAVYFTIYGLFASVGAGIYGQGYPGLYSGFYAFASFWCAILMFMITRKLNQIPSQDQSGVNMPCYKSSLTLFKSILYHDEFLVQRRLALYFICILFFNSFVQTYIGMRCSFRDNEGELYEQPIIFTVLVVPIMIFGLGMLIYLIYSFFFMLIDFIDYSTDILYQFHIVNSIEKLAEQRRETFLKAYLFCGIAVMYYLVKAILYLVYGILVDELVSQNIQPYSIIVLIQSILCGVQFLWIGFSIKNIMKRGINSDFYLVKNNQTSFTCWFTLILSLIFSSRHIILTYIIAALLIVQAGYGLEVIPFYLLWDFYDSDEYIFGKSFIFWDNATITFQLGWQILKLFMKLMHGEQFVQTGFVFSVKNFQVQAQGTEQVLPQDQNAQIQVQGNEKLPIKTQEKELCKLCNQIMLENELIEITNCSSSHSFHKFCLTSWMFNHQTCPSCETEQK